MRFFVQQRRGRGMRDIADGAVGVRVTDRYLELEARLDDGSVRIAYAIPLGARKVVFVANLEDEVDPLINDLDGASDATVHEIAERYPTFVRLALSGAEDSLADGALVPMADPDTGAQTVVVALSLDGVEAAHPQTWLEDAGLPRLRSLTDLTAGLLAENEARNGLAR